MKNRIDHPNHFALHIDAMRRQKGITIEDLCFMAGISQDVYYRHQRGGDIKLSAMLKLLSVFNGHYLTLAEQEGDDDA